ncbi:tbc domain containing protein [Nannochloropsis gaditana CCMP526]|uniref:tbc domain containing protein n=1 Tax=Nannochloropsis gaditana (strain CCMP526) TaxID=1093141 RepID=UPI00029F6CAC|nr:tbc domain containing protein [Nannochloropsis gaditana CCMP526]EKU20416.1 tbc domain containing protein [Nannochloropsis gaditana CCMP526]|eukprot:XP_005855943.1 tbc domain containing protein [Nannochloropsis gaditana CCMP526]
MQAPSLNPPSPAPTSVSSSTPPPHSDANAGTRGEQDTEALLRRALPPHRGAPPPSPLLVRTLCQQLGSIPPDLRRDIWPLLLLGPDAYDADVATAPSAIVQGFSGKEEGATAGAKVGPHCGNKSSPVDGPSRGLEALCGDDAKPFSLAQAIEDVPLDLPNQRVVEIDALRTRSELPLFKSPGTQAMIERVLTLYCKLQGISYKQGLNEVLAPFVQVVMGREGGGDGEGRRPDRLGEGRKGEGVGEEAGGALQEDGEGDGGDRRGQGCPPSAAPSLLIYRCFTRFLHLLLGNLYSDEDFHLLQALFLLFRLLLLYHCPRLSLRLDACGLPPELYLTPWVLTLLARSLDMPTTLALWDHYLLEQDPLLHHFLLLALLRRHRASLLAAPVDLLPETLASLSFSGTAHVASLVAEAKALRAQTPDRGVGRGLGCAGVRGGGGGGRGGRGGRGEDKGGGE